MGALISLIQEKSLLQNSLWRPGYALIVNCIHFPWAAMLPWAYIKPAKSQLPPAVIYRTSHYTPHSCLMSPCLSAHHATALSVSMSVPTPHNCLNCLHVWDCSPHTTLLILLVITSLTTLSGQSSRWTSPLCGIYLQSQASWRLMLIQWLSTSCVHSTQHCLLWPPFMIMCIPMIR